MSAPPPAYTPTTQSAEGAYYPEPGERLVVSVPEAQRMLDCGNTKIHALLAAGELESYLDGGARKITIRSIYARIERLLAAGGTRRSPNPRAGNRADNTDSTDSANAQ
jgi:hypothetical protein